MGDDAPMFQPVGEAVQSLEDNDDALPPVQEVESLCMSCGQNGTTRLLLTSIPHFREVVVMSFACPHCGTRNTEVQSAGQIQPHGSVCLLRVSDSRALSRNVVKSDTCAVRIPELDLEIPAQRGQLTTVEGVVSDVIRDIKEGQPVRKHADPESYDKIESFLQRAQTLLDDPSTSPFRIELDDPAGNSFIEPQPGEPATVWSVRQYTRTPEQNAALGLSNTEAPPASADVLRDEPEAQAEEGGVHTFPSSCPSCMHPCETHMKLVDIPHFKEVIIMATVCDKCGFRSNEVKTGGAVPDKGRRITLKCKDFPDDLSRDILKSETASLTIPEIGLDLAPGTLGGRFTTIEGLLSQVDEELYAKVYTHEGDSMLPEQKAKWDKFLADLRSVRNGERPFTLVLDDALAASHVQNLYAPDPDPEMLIEDYERTAEQNDDLGLNDIKTDV